MRKFSIKTLVLVAGLATMFAIIPAEDVACGGGWIGKPLTCFPY